MKYFGDRVWDAPITDDVEIVEVPVGKVCYYCDEEIKETDYGFLLPHYDEEGVDRVIHLECNLRMGLGSVGHLKGTCSCVGGNEEDPPGSTLHQAAQAVLFYLTMNNKGRFHKKKEAAGKQPPS